MVEDAQLLASLHKKRGNLKRKLTNFSAHIDAVKPLGENNTYSQTQIIELQTRIDRFISIIDRVEELQSEIFEISISEEQDESDWVSEFEENYFAVLAKAKTIVADAESKNGAGSGTLSGESVSAISSSHSGNMRLKLKQLKLPTIALPKFEGQYTKWLEFHDIFVSLIHENKSLSDVQRFHYLKASLEKGAAEIIRSLPLTSSNYSIAWNLICERYTNKKLLIQNHLRALFHLKECSKESASELRAMLDTVIRHLRSLEALGLAVEHWDPVIIYLVTSKFDKVTARSWEQEIFQYELPTLEELKTFLRQKANMLDNLGLCDSKEVKVVSKFGSKPQRVFTSSTLSCYYCKKTHALYNCPEFLAMTISTRIATVKKLGLCLNCFRSNHTVDKCEARSRGCRKCKQNHNTLLHCSDASKSEGKQSESVQALVSRQFSVTAGNVLLATAVILVKDIHGQWHKCRALLDSAAQSNFITREMMQKLNLAEVKVDMSVQGINQVISPITSQCTVHIKSRITNFNKRLNFLILNRICEDLPSIAINTDQFNIPTNLELADPSFDVSDKIDMLIGAQLFWSLLVKGQIKLGKNLPILQNSKFGWILSGPVVMMSTKPSNCLFAQSLDCQCQLQKFWDLEEVPQIPSWSQDQHEAESHFNKNIKRDNEGRCVVSVPFKGSLSQLGDSRNTAERRLENLEKKLKANPKLKESYIQFMREYESLGHMKKLDNPDNTQPNYYLPHHCVINEGSKTTKLRVVFDGSCPTTTGISVNDLQLVGPPIQDILFNILVRFRFHPVAFSADVKKMYRQVQVSPKDRAFQRILWRYNESDPVQTFELNTVTYGTASAPFLATRCLMYIADLNVQKFPEACKIIKSDFYVDDLLSGAETPEKAAELCHQILEILKTIHFPLHKWISNVPQVLPCSKDLSDTTTEVYIGSGYMTKTLGLYWSQIEDTLNYKISSFKTSAEVITKRTLLSELSQTFDPLGLLSPCLIIGKTILQQLWHQGTGWDDEVPQSIASKWTKLRESLIQLNHSHIPRHVVCKMPIRIELHCFSDASEMAYATCIYVKSIDSEGKTSVNLLCAKAKVAPLKPITIPRLELCGAHLSAKLMAILTNAVRIKIDQIFMWTDSTIVLGWLNASPNTLKVFVSHRVADIQTKCKSASWFHVPTKDNPADLASRGVCPADLNTSILWWHGPDWLAKEQINWPNKILGTPFDSLPEVKRTEKTFMVANLKNPIEIKRFSTYNKLIRTTAFCFRFIHNCKSKVRITGLLTSTEISKAEMFLVKMIQREIWSQEIHYLELGKSLPRNSKLICLSPFLDSNKLLRVGGRLQESNLPYNQKHQLLIPKHDFTALLFIHEHQRLFHAGPQQLLFSLREKFWPLNGRNYARITTHKCIRCFRCKPINETPLMGNLPAERIQPAFPFQITGVDFTGPFFIKDRQGRNCKVTKCWVAIFVCFVVKAIHIELVSSLSTEAFLASLRRFIAKRGKPTKIFSDNGSNFVGASNELSHFVNQLRSISSEIAEALSTESIRWEFIPPRSPNFGGLWEAGVKSFKFHLRRVAGNTHFTFEQFYTLINQIEAILNSRPISAMSSNPNDMEPITPAHFLIGRSLTSLPEPTLLNIPINHLQIYENIQRMVQEFWCRWKRDYLHSLQVRRKWLQKTTNLRVGNMVLLQEDGAPSLSWPLGRVIEVSTGKDDQVRVVKVQTAKGIFTRTCTKIFPLPIEKNLTNDDDQNIV